MAEVYYYFGFLFGKGYRIRESNVPLWDTRLWSVVFESAESLIDLRYNDGEARLIFSPQIDPGYQCDLRALIYYLTKGKPIPAIIRRQDDEFYRSTRKQLDWLSYLLRAYIDKIAPCLTREFSVRKDEILTAAKEYRLIYERRLE